MTSTLEKDKKGTRAILKETTLLVGAKYLSQFALVVRGFLIARVLGPDQYGIWSMMRTVFFAQDYTDLGVRDGLCREYPLKKAAGQDDDAVRIMQTALWWNGFTGSVLCCIFLIAAWLPAFRSYKTEICLLAFLLPINALYLFLSGKFKAEQKAVLLSKSIFAYAILNTLLGVALLFAYQINGLLVGMLLTHFAILGWLVYTRNLSFAYKFDRKTAMKLLKIGFPIAISSISFFLMLNADKVIVFLMLGPTNTGYYGLASFLVQSVNYIPNSISTVIFPRIMSKFGETQDRQSIEQYFIVPIAVLSVIVPVLLGLVYLNIDLVIHFFLPRFEQAIGLLRVLIIGLFFSTLWIAPMNILIAFNKQKKLMYVNLALVVVGIGLDIAAIKMGFGIFGVGAASVFIFFVLSLGYIIYTLYCFKKSFREILFCLKDMYTPLVYFAGLLILFTHINLDMPRIAYNIVASICYLIGSLPIVVALDRKTGFWRHIRSFKKKEDA